MADDQRPIIIIKRIKKIASNPHHGGAWKVAYADFVTAMMAFFLLLWLLSAVTEEQKVGIANFFRPTLSIDSTATTLTILEGQPQVVKEIVDGESSKDPPEPDTVPSENATSSPNPEPADAGGAKPVDIKEAEAAIAKREERRFAEVKKQIEKAIEDAPDLRDLKKNLLIEQTEEGLRIQLLDREKISMFPSGSAVVNEHSRQLLQKVAQAIAGLPNKLSISGHTDATPYAGAGQYSNWELSTDRANASRRVLAEAGIDTGRVETVNGKAETDPLVKSDPFAPQNRRISIVLLREKPSATPPSNTTSQAPAAPSEPVGPPAELIPPEAPE